MVEHLTNEPSVWIAFLTFELSWFCTALTLYLVHVFPAKLRRFCRLKICRTCGFVLFHFVSLENALHQMTMETSSNFRQVTGVIRIGKTVSRNWEIRKCKKTTKLAIKCMSRIIVMNCAQTECKISDLMAAHRKPFDGVRRCKKRIKRENYPK